MPLKHLLKTDRKLFTSVWETPRQHTNLHSKIRQITSLNATIGICDELNLHATLSLGVGSPELGLVEAVDTLRAVLLYQTAFAVSTAPGANSPGRKPTQNLPFPEPVALPPPLPPPPPLDVFLRDNPLSPALISDVIVIICHIWRREIEEDG